ncbi:Glucose-specific phosphotransferase enzyme IIA component [Fervidicola ferrireducens]|uniref:Glucose-specific phosphotransferase enzyme IIA component n=2 Tax=Fervidicola ferrireducens TaxID=520764 RepID=A0A140LD06_9FIRM|nr:Glucose-specific phosphotransferase enzyme IIA component [Fervidicola ferrireducens]
MLFSIFGRNKLGDPVVKIVAPMSGRVVDLAEVPDKVFSAKMVGDGVAIEPSEGLVVSPFDGLVKQVFPTGHALVMESKEGLSLLIHIGIETVNLKGEGFKVLVSEGQAVKVGTPLVEFEMELIKDKGFPLVSPFVIPEMDLVDKIKSSGLKEVKKGQDVLIEVFLKRKDEHK